MIKGIGIYKITSPNGKIYIGQSWNLYKRINSHQNKPANSFVSRSINKYGKNNHRYEVVHQLPIDISQKVMDIYEQLYIDLHRDAGFVLMNLKEAGSKGRLSDDVKRKVSIGLTGKKQSPETIAKRMATIKLLGKEIREEISKKCSEASISFYNSQEGMTHRKNVGALSKSLSGIKRSDETKERLRISHLGFRPTMESLDKKSKSLKKYWSLRTPEQRREKMKKAHAVSSIINRGRKDSDLTKDRKSESALKAWAKRKGGLL